MPETGTVAVAPATADAVPGPASTTANIRWKPWRWAAGFTFACAAGAALYFEPWIDAPPEVVVEIATPAPVVRVLAVNGRIAAVLSVDVRSAVSGTLEAIPVSEGVTVGAGEILAYIDASSQEAVVRQSQAALEAGRVTQAQSGADFKRLSGLAGVVPRVTIDAAESTARAAAEEARRLAAMVDQAQIQLSRYTVLAPVAGTIMSITGEPGQLVDPAKALVTLADLGRLVVEANVDEVYATQIILGQPVLLAAPTGLSRQKRPLTIPSGATGRTQAAERVRSAGCSRAIRAAWAAS